MVEAAEADMRRVAKGLKRPIEPALVPLPRPFGASTAKRVHATLRAALNAALRAEELTHNVAAQAHLPVCRLKKVRPWTPEQLGTWLDSICGDRLYPLFHLAAFNGLRRGELAGLRWEDVDLDRGRMAVRFQITSVSYRKARRAIKDGGRAVYLTPVKTEQSQDHLVDVDPVSLDLLRRVRRQQVQEACSWGAGTNSDGLVFAAENGEPYDPEELYRRFQASVRAAGLERVPLHMLRHVAASLLIEAGVDIAIISKRLGHSKISLTADTYGHLIGNVSKRAAAAAVQLVPRRVTDGAGPALSGASEDVAASNGEKPYVADGLKAGASCPTCPARGVGVEPLRQHLWVPAKLSGMNLVSFRA